ncbi:MAG: prolyl oligopeptidase family serine peptidase, partial [Victivallales bacterium]|nr:prolyl oligopeptidase family serine peptidase [Victivallales bacterium]
MNNPYQHSVIDYYVAKLRKKRSRRQFLLSSLTTRDEALAYQELVRKNVQEAFGPYPEKSPLEARVTGTLECEGYRIEKVLFCSRPGYLVSANLYIPDGLTEAAPAVLGACGHSGLGKACEAYQKYAIRLAKNGFVVLIYDPVHQGERDQYVNLDYLGAGAGLCAAHNVMAKQLELVGESMPAWRMWDGIRALDYLLTRPEVDPSRVGITGNSGGGTLTEWIWANEPRLAFAAPSCHVTTFLGNLENELPT